MFAVWREVVSYLQPLPAPGITGSSPAPGPQDAPHPHGAWTEHALGPGGCAALQELLELRARPGAVTRTGFNEGWAPFGLHTQFLTAAHPSWETSAGDFWESQSSERWVCGQSSDPGVQHELLCSTWARAELHSTLPDSLTDIPRDAARTTSNVLQMMESSSLYPEGSSGVRQLSKAPQHTRGDLCSSSLTLPLWKDARQSLVLQ